jgi:hypothetical protein
MSQKKFHPLCFANPEIIKVKVKTGGETDRQTDKILIEALKTLETLQREQKNIIKPCDKGLGLLFVTLKIT